MNDKSENEILHLNCRAHPQETVYATLRGKLLTIECANCGKVVIRMRVKEVCEP
jgi:uncharacterized OB-fold protein